MGPLADVRKSSLSSSRIACIGTGLGRGEGVVEAQGFDSDELFVLSV